MNLMKSVKDILADLKEIKSSLDEMKKRSQEELFLRHCLPTWNRSIPRDPNQPIEWPAPGIPLGNPFPVTLDPSLIALLERRTILTKKPVPGQPSQVTPESSGIHPAHMSGGEINPEVPSAGQAATGTSDAMQKLVQMAYEGFKNQRLLIKTGALGKTTNGFIPSGAMDDLKKQLELSPQEMAALAKEANGFVPPEAPASPAEPVQELYVNKDKRRSQKPVTVNFFPEQTYARFYEIIELDGRHRSYVHESQFNKRYKRLS